MTTRSKELTVGIVFFAIMCSIGVATILIRGVNPLKPPFDWVVYFPDGVGGLREGNVVRISGLEVGQVEEMRLQTRGVLAYLKVQRGVELYPGYQIHVRAFSPLGGKYVDVRRGDMTHPALVETLGYEDFEASYPPDQPFHLTGESDGRPLKGGVEPELITELAEMAEAIRPDVEKTVANIRLATDRVAETQGTVGKLLGDTTLHDTLVSAADNLDKAAGHLATIFAKVDRNQGTLGRLINDPRLYDSTADAMASARSIADKVDRGRGPLGKLVNDEQVAMSLERSIGHLEKALAAVADDSNGGRGTVGKLIHSPDAHEELEATLAELRTALTTINQGKSPVGVLVTSEAAGMSLKRTLASIENTAAHIERSAYAIRKGRGTVGRLIHDDRLVNEAERVLVQLRESTEDLREQAPINAFIQAVFQAF